MASEPKAQKIPTRVRRIAQGEIAAASAHLCRRPLRHENIRQARRHLKKLRALLRLIRDQIPVGLFKKENRSFRDLGRYLAPIRDARVVVKTATLLENKVPKPGTALARAIAIFKQRDAALRTPDARSRRCLHLLELAHRRVETWPIENLTHRNLREGVRKTFRRGRKAFRKAMSEPKDEVLHNLRKRVKDLHYEVHILNSKGTFGTEKTCANLVRLDDALGDDHDLAVLTGHLRRPRFPMEKEELREILEEIRKRRSRLQKRALILAEKLYSKKPGRFAGKSIEYELKVSSK